MADMSPPPLHTDALELAILTFVLDRHPAPVHRDELVRVFGGDDWGSAVAALRADGLLHREGRLYLSSRASVRALELLG
jgi:hypothetical protein